MFYALYNMYIIYEYSPCYNILYKVGYNLNINPLVFLFKWNHDNSGKNDKLFYIGTRRSVTFYHKEKFIIYNIYIIR